MRIGILTHYMVNNQGAQLQLAAMHAHLRELGHDPVVLNYEKNFDLDSGEQKKNSASLRALPYYVKHYLLEKGPGLTLFNARKVQAHRKALQAYSCLPYDTDQVDTVLIGSDEVFSVDVGCNRMMYGYGLKAPALAYAPAFGRTTVEDLRRYGYEELVTEGLKKMPFLSARDTHTQEMIRTLTGREVPMVCDPVLLYQGGFSAEIRPIGKPYLIVYSYDRNMTDKKEIEAIRAYAKARRLLTVSLGTYHGWCDKNIVCGAAEWYTYFRDAACVVTDTFHGAVTAMKNHCNLAVLIRKSINQFKMTSLLDQTGLTERRLPELTQTALEEVLSRPINYEETDARIAAMAEESDRYLRHALNQIQGQGRADQGAGSWK